MVICQKAAIAFFAQIIVALHYLTDVYLLLILININILVFILIGSTKKYILLLV